jgi:hypothetical protein
LNNEIYADARNTGLKKKTDKFISGYEQREIRTRYVQSMLIKCKAVSKEKLAKQNGGSTAKTGSAGTAKRTTDFARAGYEWSTYCAQRYVTDIFNSEMGRHS